MGDNTGVTGRTPVLQVNVEDFVETVWGGVPVPCVEHITKSHPIDAMKDLRKVEIAHALWLVLWYVLQCLHMQYLIIFTFRKIFH